MKYKSILVNKKKGNVALNTRITLPKVYMDQLLKEVESSRRTFANYVSLIVFDYIQNRRRGVKRDEIYSTRDDVV